MPPNVRPKPTASLRFEQACWDAGCRAVVGLDEAGRGTWAGPVAAGAVCLPPHQPDLLARLEGVRDSKQISPRPRAALADHIREAARAWGVGSASSAEVDSLGIVAATRLAMRRALDAAALQPDFLLLDGFAWPEITIPQQHLVKGDQRSLSIAAASILAKVWRDDYMRALDSRYPAYGFAAHKGYGTRAHKDALAQYGPTPEHRLSFKPLHRWTIEAVS